MKNGLQNYYFTSESVSAGHPDKVCDQISDALVDAHLAQNPHAKVALETLASKNLIVIAGETHGAKLTAGEIEDIIRATVRQIGYEQEDFHWQNAKICQHIQQQSADIRQGVAGEGNREQGAGDQGIMFGYASDETEALMPAPIFYAHRILQTLARERAEGRAAGLDVDAKSQVTLVYEQGRPVRAHSVVVSSQHAEGMEAKVRALIRPVVEEVLPSGWMCAEENFHVNPTGRFVLGGPAADAGLTGRKIVVDTYGGAAPHGGGAFSGKDPTKVDRSAAYAARYLAKNIVAAGLAKRCTIQIAYAIGRAAPLALYCDLHGSGAIAEEKLVEVLREIMDLTPAGIRAHLALNRPIYQRTAVYGHFGRQPDDDGGFSWEKTDLADALRAAIR